MGIDLFRWGGICDEDLRERLQQMGEILPLRLCLVRPIYNDKCQVTDVALS